MTDKLPIRQELVDDAAKALDEIEGVYIVNTAIVRHFAPLRRLVEACRSQRTVDERIAELLKANTALVLANRELKANSQLGLHRGGVVPVDAEVPNIVAGQGYFIPAIMPRGEYVVSAKRPLVKETDNG